MHVCTCVHVCGGLVIRLCLTLEIPLTGARQAPLSMGFSRQEHRSELPFPSPGHLPNLGIEPGFPVLQADSLPSEPLGKPKHMPRNSGFFQIHMKKIIKLY